VQGLLAINFFVLRIEENGVHTIYGRDHDEDVIRDFAFDLSTSSHGSCLGL